MGGDWRSRTAYSRLYQPDYSSVPLWEKAFCTSVCYVPWGKICAAKHRLSDFKNIAGWDDSGALEGFENAKARYWAEINGLPCEIPMPDPDTYIDEVDHTAVIDPELVEDLYKKPPPPPTPANEYEDLSYEAFLNANLPVKATGWGDAEDGEKKENQTPRPATGWDDAEDCGRKHWNSGNLWENYASRQEHGSWGRHWENWHKKGNGRKRNGYGSRFSRPGNQLNNCQKTMEAGKPVATAQWRPKAAAACDDRLISIGG